MPWIRFFAAVSTLFTAELRNKNSGEREVEAQIFDGGGDI